MDKVFDEKAPPGAVRLRGRYRAEVYGPDGKLKEAREGNNVVTTVGKEFLASYLYSGAAAASTFTAKYAAVGTSTTPEAAADTAMGTELVRTTGTVSYVSGAIVQVTATFTTGTAAGQVTEYGLFTSSTGGTLFSRDTESTITVGASDTLKVVYQLTLS